MHYVVLLIVLAVIAFLLYKSVQDARARAEGGLDPRPAPQPRQPSPKPRPRPRPKARARKPKIDEEALGEHVAKLRQAVDTDLISLDEAVASVVRQTDGALSEDAARKLLSERPSG